MPGARHKGGKAGNAGGTPCGETQGRRDRRREGRAPSNEGQGRQGRRQGLTPWVPTIMVDPAAMAEDGGSANGEAHVAHAVVGEVPEVDRSTDLKMSRQFHLCGSQYAHVDPVEVIDAIPAIADQRLYDACVRNCARAHTRRIHARYEALSGFVDMLTEPGKANHVGDRVAEFHGDPFFGNQGPQRRVYEVMWFCNEVFRYQVHLHLFHRLV